ncbi:glycoside hydrolase family 43 protein [Silvibacterium dinghuense]|uniref:Beta-xylosidase n=1 Tax=Silvibacterium dinghuense TaxID=1560006 RepID=A0A4Q1SHQ1_9BACT|nr:family 43 glycosylhydrolase [Silvibacterium dinghuense]RXS97118.1 hypothetical protein ESZ00_04155 [Silvibacterium dinghuense]GGG96402.1 hypothetical protein GCM10011586_09440 [Silvibacterium dinghuense]
MRYWKALTFLRLLLPLLLLVSQASTPLMASSKDPHFDYENPIQTDPIRDPQITKVGSTWYMTGTAFPFFDGTAAGPIPGVKLWSSTDLTHWKDLGVLVAPSKDRWYRRRFWAPELFPYKGKWYLTFSCPFGETPDSPESIALAVADTITGPYKVLTEDKPLTEGNGATLFQDDDGKVYLFRDGVTATLVDLPNAVPIGQPFPVIQPGADGAWDGPAKGGPSVGLEGPTVMKHGRSYILLYSSWGRGYEVGEATADTITGPWRKSRSNPIYGAQDEEWAKIYKHAYTQKSDVPYGQLGHGSPFIGPDGDLWFGCHGYLKGKGQLPHLVITPMRIDHDQVKMVVTWTPQVLFYPKKFHVRPTDTRLASPDLATLADQ